MIRMAVAHLFDVEWRRDVSCDDNNYDYYENLIDHWNEYDTQRGIFHV